jgi:tripeptide aminopeptidase
VNSSEPNISSQERRLVERFCALAKIASPSGSEGACADAVTAELNALGLEVIRDDAGDRLGSDGANLYCELPATTHGLAVFLCAHLDTVPPAAPLSPVVVDGIIRNATPSIIGADNKAAVAVLLGTARTLVEEARAHAGVELLFTIGEEQGLRGVRAFDSSRLRARTGFVLDHPGAIGGFVAAAPSRFIVTAAIRGRAAHAGIAPEDGVNAIVALAKAIAAFPDGEAAVTVNVGQVSGGTAPNVVPDLASVSVDIRSIRHEAAERVVNDVRQTLTDSARQAGCTVDVEVESAYRGYRIPDDSPALRLASTACTHLSLDVVPLETRGGSDANVLRARGLDCLNLAHAVVDFHGPDEHVAVADLVLMKQVMLEIVSAATARVSAQPSAGLTASGGGG